jgi:prepilin-type N-terminal cleavage/methylation domain-containing protein
MRRSLPGYTLIELLIVVILIGIITALAAPQIGQSVANIATSDAASDVMVSFRAARTMSAQKGLAHGVFIDRTAPGIVRVDRSATNLCQGLPACTSAAPDFGGPDCAIRVLDLGESRFQRRGVRIPNVEIMEAQPNPLSLCIVPNGRMFWRQGVAGNWLRLTRPVEVSIDRTDEDGRSIGVVRQVLINTMGIPRMLI